MKIADKLAALCRMVGAVSAPGRAGPAFLPMLERDLRTLAAEAAALRAAPAGGFPSRLPSPANDIARRAR